jgi:transcription elongation GreA/GreB family factor
VLVSGPYHAVARQQTPAPAEKGAGVSRAFVREDDQTGGDQLPERPLSPNPNLVTRRGLALIEQGVAQSQEQLHLATAAGDEDAAARAARDLRYWAARHASAELVEPAPQDATVRFGVAVTLAREAHDPLVFRIVGEDEADPAEGRIAWTSPVAKALLGAELGERRRLPIGEVEIVAVDPAPEPATA